MYKSNSRTGNRGVTIITILYMDYKCVKYGALLCKIWWKRSEGGNIVQIKDTTQYEEGLIEAKQETKNTRDTGTKS